MDIDSYLKKTLSELGLFYHKMSASIDPPILIQHGSRSVWRYKEETDSLACFLKGVKIVSTINASLILLEAGFTQEIGALFRMSDDFSNEILFLLGSEEGDKLSKDQARFLKNFFQEEFNDPADPLGSEQKRDTVSARKVHSFLANNVHKKINPSDAKEVLRTSHQTFSGYVHAAYPHIMEMFRGPTPLLNGMPNTPPIDVWRDHVIIQVHRTIMISYLIAEKLGIDEVYFEIDALLIKFEADTKCMPIADPNEILKNMKKNKTRELLV